MGGGTLQVVMHRLQIGKSSDAPLEPRKGLRARARQQFSKIIHSKSAKPEPDALNPAEAAENLLYVSNGDSIISTASAESQQTEQTEGFSDTLKSEEAADNLFFVSNGDSFRSSASAESQQTERSSDFWDRGGGTGEGMEFQSRDGGCNVETSPDVARSDDQGTSWPEEFVCPISKNLMADPVLVSSGTSYERENIRAYLDLGHRNCLKTGETLEHLMLTKNLGLKKAIDNWCESNRISKPVSPDPDTARDYVERVCREVVSSLTYTNSSSRELQNVLETATSGDSSASSSRNSGVEHFRSTTPGSVRTRPTGPNKFQQIPEAVPVNDNDSGSDLSPSSEWQQNRERLFEARHTWSGDKPRKLTQVPTNTGSMRRESAPNHGFERFCDEGGSSSSGLSSEHRLTFTGTNRPGQRVWRGRPRGQESPFPLPLTTTPSAFSEPPSGGGRSPISAEGVSDSDLNALVQKLKHRQILEQEQAVSEVRRLTRVSVQNRLTFCEPEFLEVLLPLTQSRYSSVQINAVATVMILSLQNENKLKVARAGAIPALVDVLKSGHPEAQEHAAGALFSLALNDENKMAIGVLGAIPPLIHLLRRGTKGARRDAAKALYQLSLAHMNRNKLIKSGGVGIFLGIARDERSDIVSSALYILCNLAPMPEGRVALAELKAVDVLVGLLTKGDEDEGQEGVQEGVQESKMNWPDIREQAAATLHQLSHNNVRFKTQAMQAGAVSGLQRLVREGTPRAREKATSLLAILRDAPSADDQSDSWSSGYGRSNAQF